MEIFCDRSSTEIEHRLVELECATDIVQFSFVAQNSISSLDLPQQDALNSFKDDFFIGFSNFSVLDSSVQYPKYVINTEEKCRKILSVTRDVLYRLHLDLPRKRECSLKDGPEPENMKAHEWRRHIGKITVHPNFHFTVLAGLVKEAVKRSDKKLKMIKWLVTFKAVTEDALLWGQHVDYFADCMYPEVTESAFVKAFVKKFNFKIWMMHNKRAELLEFFLFHLCQNEGTLKDNKSFLYELIEACIVREHFLDIATVLKYQDATRVLQRAAVWSIYLPFDREGPSRVILLETERWMSPKRFYLLMQLRYIFFHSRRTAYAAECLRLLWNSLPDAFFSFKEIEMALQAGMSSETIRDLYNFYTGAVGVFHERLEPRSLKHLSRQTVRRMLWESGCWIPDGIKLTGMPRVLQSFLNLEAEFCH